MSAIKILYFAILSCNLFLTYGRPNESKLRADYTYSSNTRLHNYYKFHEEKTTWQDAVAKCKAEGAQLFYPINKAEAKEVDNLLRPWARIHYIWIGAYDHELDNIYIETIDGRPLSEVHNKWDVKYGQPKRSEGGRHCAVMWGFDEKNNYELWLRPCTNENAFVCKYESSHEKDFGCLTPSQHKITNNLYDGSHCYKFHEEKTNWQNAEAQCKSEGAQLFYPVNKAEARGVDRLLRPWIGRNYIWIGVSDLHLNEVYQTVDGRPLNEVHHEWDVAYGQPDRSEGGHCVGMYDNYVLWLIQCSEKNSFICKHPLASKVESETTSAAINNTYYHQQIAPVLFSSNGYTYSPNTSSFYKYYPAQEMWYDAVNKCKSEGAKLFYPVDEAEAKEVRDLINPWKSYGAIWIGISDLKTNAVFETVDGRDLKEVHHRWEGNPKLNADKHCVNLWSNFNLDVRACDARLDFVCKYDYTPQSSSTIGAKQTTDVHVKPLGWN